MTPPKQIIQERMAICPEDYPRRQWFSHIVMDFFDEPENKQLVTHGEAEDICQFLVSFEHENLMWLYLSEFHSVTHLIQAWRFQLQPNYRRHKRKMTG